MLLQLLLHVRLLRLVLHQCVLQTLVLLVDRLDPRLVVADLGLHVIAFAPEIPGVALGSSYKKNKNI